MQWPWSKKEVVKEQIETKSAVLSGYEALADLLSFSNQGYGATASGAMRLYEESTAVSIPINFIADAFKCIQPVIKEGDEIITEDPVLDLLKVPSPFYTQILLLENIAKNFLIAGDMELLGIGNINRPPIELQPINPKNITHVEGTNGYAESYIVSGDTFNGSYKLVLKGNRARYIADNLREMKVIRSYSTRNNSLLRGESKLLAASDEARQNILGNTHNLTLLEKGGQVDLIFNFKTDLDTDDFEEAKKRIRDQYGGPRGERISVAAGGELEIIPTNTKNTDMDFANLQTMAKMAVALQYKVPIALLSAEAMTLDNYREAKLALYDDAVLPLADVIFGGLTDFLLPRFGQDPKKRKITYNPDQITALALRRNEELKLRKELNVETDNEIRALIGREPLPGGDDLYKPTSEVPVGQNPLLNPPDPEVIP